MNIPLLVCRSIGFVGYMRVQSKEHSVIEAHPDNQIPDLRLDKPFQTLIDHINSINLDQLSLKDHSHTPFLIILYKFLQKWQQQSGQALPTNYKEKEALRNLIKSGLRLDEQGIPAEEDNFQEAIKAVNSSLAPTKIPSNVQEILNDDSCINLTQKVDFEL